ncbi:MAG: hypothetical protein D6785_05125 [Planctomycetota bacterium]|nr:MAG: hypothetical protein D6785_05125 [Planctomycetota bacterium]
MKENLLEINTGKDYFSQISEKNQGRRIGNLESLLGRVRDRAVKKRMHLLEKSCPEKEGDRT